MLITGATDGHGRRVALDLAARGWDVLVHGRDAARGEAVAAEAGEGAQVVLADLASLDAVRALAADVRDRVPAVDVLVNNAGVVSRERRESADGIELTFAVNYLAHVLLTEELLGHGVRNVVNVSSIAAAPLDPEDPFLERSYEPMRAYGQSKLAQVMWTLDLAERLRADGVVANALHPATLMDTTMVREGIGRVMSTVEEGAEATVRLVTEDVGSGRFYDGLRESRADMAAYDAHARTELRELTARLLWPDP